MTKILLNSISSLSITPFQQSSRGEMKGWLFLQKISYNSRMEAFVNSGRTASVQHHREPGGKCTAFQVQTFVVLFFLLVCFCVFFFSNFFPEFTKRRTNS